MKRSERKPANTLADMYNVGAYYTILNMQLRDLETKVSNGEPVTLCGVDYIPAKQCDNCPQLEGERTQAYRRGFSDAKNIAGRQLTTFGYPIDDDGKPFLPGETVIASTEFSSEDVYEIDSVVYYGTAKSDLPSQNWSGWKIVVHTRVDYGGATKGLKLNPSQVRRPNKQERILIEFAKTLNDQDRVHGKTSLFENVLRDLREE